VQKRCPTLASVAAVAALVVGACPAAVHAQDDAPKSGGGRSTPARIANINECKPAYPKESTRAGETGTTHLRLRVSAEGKLLDATVSRSSGFERLDNATLSALANCRYTPGTVEGVPAETATTIAYNWRLDSPPAAAANPCAPEYPAASVQAGEQGKTTLRFKVSKVGQAEDIEVEESSGSAQLDGASIAALRRCRFRLTPEQAASVTPVSTKVEFIWRLVDGVPAAPLGPEEADPFRPKL
jgi:periplasmic protein TonB